jgi:RHS repeat-associated protein
VSDVDSANFDTGKLTVDFSANGQSQDQLAISHEGTGAGQIGVSGTNVSYGGTTMGSITTGPGTTKLVVSLNSYASTNAVQALLRRVTYWNSSDNPSTLVRTVRAGVSDGDGAVSAATTMTVTVIAVDDPPVVQFVTPSLNYTENNAPTILATNATVSDIDSGNFNTGTLTVAIATNALPEDQLNISSEDPGTGINVSDTNVFSGTTQIGTITTGPGTTTLVVTFNSSATPALAQALLRRVTYWNSSDNPSTLVRTVRAVVTDGSGGNSEPTTMTVTVTPVNDPPVIQFVTPSLSYTQNYAATILTTNATVTDVDSTNFNTGTLTVNFATNGLPEDQLGISSQGTSAGQIGLSGTNVSYGGTNFGNLTTGPGTNVLVVSLNSNASTNAVQALLRRVTYWNSSSNPSTLVRTVQAVLTDGGIGGASAPTTMTVTLTLVISSPVVHLINPTNNQIFALSPTNILLVATATNAGATISQVEFYTNNVWLGEATPVSNQWQFLWQNVLPGTNRITAWATNNFGLFASDSATNVIINAMPLVAITFPTNSTSTNLTSFRAPTNLVLRATGSDPDGTNLTVQFFYRTNTERGAFWTNFTYSATRTNYTNFFLTWTNCPADTHSIYALATDGRGASSASDLIVFQVTPTNPPPSVWITWPTNGASFPAGATITITAMASNSPAGGHVTNVEFFADTRLLGNDTNSPYSLTECCWKSGKFVLRAKASDNLGASGISEAVEIVVAKDAPVGDGFWDAEFSKGSLSALPRFVTATGLGVADGGTVYAGSVYDCSVEATADGTNWAELITWPYMSGDIYAITPVGTNIYAGGFWRSVEYYLGRWDGASWHSVGNRFTQGNLLPTVLAIAEMGGDLYVAGDFISAGTNPTNSAVQRVARLNPQTDEWQPVGNGLTNGTVYAMAVLGGELYIGGTFTNAGGNPQANYVARLCGNAWTNLSGGVSDGGGSPPWVAALAVSGTNLFVGGNFRAAGAQTNANGVACWNTVDWRSLNGGIGALELGTPLNTLPEGPLHVYALAACDNRVFVGGQFTNVLMGANSLAANNIAMATWSEADQNWSWSDLDGGVAYWSDFDDQPFVFRSVLVPGATSGSFDLYVAGLFNRVGSGQLASGCVARWRLGRGRPPGPPSLTITNPVPNAVITNINDADIPLGASARSSYTNIAAVEFFVDGLSVGGQVNPDGSCGASWPSPLPGAHLLAASVTDGAGLQGEAKPIVVTIRDPNNSVTAVSDRFAVLMNTPPANLDVLTNDATSTTNPLRLVNVLPVSAGCGTARVSHDGRYVLYQPRAETCGTDLFLYSVTDGHNTNTAYATVRVLSHPFITMTSPDASVASCLWNGPIRLLIAGLATDYDGTVTNVAISLDGSPWNHTNSGSFGFLWTNATAGFYTFSIVATDNDGLSNKLWMLLNIYETNVVNGVTAHILNLDPTPNDLVDGIPYLIREGLFVLQGEARDSNANHLVSYQLQLLRPEDNPNPEAEPVVWANVTPGPLNDAGFHLGSDSSGSLGRLDFSGIPNGTYDLKLVVHGGGNEATDIKRFRLDTQLKLGQFSFTEQDLVIPVSGIPLTVTRTYSSLNLRPADFGYGWSYSLMGMDVQLDDQRRDVTIGGNDAPFADDEDSDTGLPRVVNIRTGGGWDVTLTLPDGRRTTFAFIPTVSPSACKAYAHWTAPPDVHATLKPLGAGEDVINMLPLSQAYWQQSDNTYAPSTFDNHDISGWVLETQDGTQYRIERGNGNNVVWADDPLGNPGHYISVQAYGPPKLTSILQRSGDTIEIRDNGIFHYAGGTHLTRSVFFDRDSQGRITAIRDPNSGSTGLPVLKYVYHSENGNLLQVLKLTDRAAGTYLTTKYRYDQPRFPHYITSIENPLGVPIARNEYDDSGRLTAVVDADGQRTEFHHNITNDVEVVIDRLGHTNTYSYDSRGNVTNTINALNGITRMTYDDNNNKTNEVAFLNGQPYATNSYVFDARSFLLVSVNPLGYSNVFSYNDFGQVLTSTDARGNTSTNYYDSQTGNLLGTSDALGNSTTNFYDPNGTSLLFGSRDAIGTLSTNYYDAAGNLTATAIWDASGILSTNSFTYDNNGNRTNSTVSRRVAGTWTSAMTTYIYDGQNRLVRTIEPDGGTNTVVYNEVGKQARTIDKLGHVTSYEYDAQGRLFRTTYPDLTTETSAYDANGNRTNSVDRAIRSTTYLFDALNRLQQTIFPDNASTRTIYDSLGRVQFSVDARGTTNAFGYDVAGQRVAVTNAWGVSTVQMTNGFIFDANGNQITATDALGRTTTNVFNALNRLVQVSYADGTKMATGYDSVGRRVAETNQDGIITRFGYDGTGRLTSVTNAFGKTEQMVTRYEYDEAANLLRQIDALNRTNSFAYDALGRRIAHTMPDPNLVERFSYDYVGNLVYQTNFSGAVITNQYDLMNRLTNRASVNGYKASFAYSQTGQRTNMADASGTTSYSYDNRDRLQLKTVAWSGGPTRSLNYRFDANGNLTNLWSSTVGGVTNLYQFDALNRLTNVLANGSAAASYGFDTVGNLRSVRYGNGVTNQFQYDALNRLTNALWKLNASTLASFYYQLGLTGNRTNLSEAVNSTGRTYAWAYDSLYRLKQETLGGGTSGTLSYGFDPVGNRTNRTVTGSLSLPNQSFTFNTNDWLTGDSYDKNGNTTNSSVNSYQFDALNHLTNVNSGAVLITYDGDGNRLRKTVGGTSTFYLLDDRNLSGYVQVLEEWTASGGTTNLSRVYNYGLQLISQRQPNVSTNYFAFDGHGSTRLLTDNGGSVVNAFTFDAYGNLIASNAAPQTVYLYCGEQWDPDLGMYCNRARYFNPQIGRFWTMDPAQGNKQAPLSLHRYLYVADNPVNLVDPSGREFTLVGTLSTAGIGASIGALSTVVANHALGRAQTFSSIAMGAGLGAVLGPLAAEYAWFGVGVGAVSVASSGTIVWDVFKNPNSTYFQKVEASALLIASVGGTAVATKYARLANTKAVEAASANPATKRLFRAVGKNEAQSLRETGEFSVPASGGSTPDGQPGRWFYGTRADAEAFAAAHPKEGQTLIATEITESTIAVIKPGIDGNRTGFFVHLEDLVGAEINWLPYP